MTRGLPSAVVPDAPALASLPSTCCEQGPAAPAPTLRAYQTGAVDAVRARYAAGDRATLLVLPTGTGKTVVFAEIARRVVERGGRVLILAHRDELLVQAASKLRAVGIEAGIEKAAQRAGDAAVAVASVQTMRGRRLSGFEPDAFRLVVVDEAHHATAASYRDILDRFARARVLGVTATPDRLDGAALGEVFQSVAYRYELRDAIRDGWLCRIEARRVRLAVDLDAVHTRAGDFDLAELEEAYGTEAAVRAVVNPLLELAGARRAMLFAVSVAHAERLAAAINEREPGSARAASGEMPADERRQVVDAFRAGQLRVLVNCQLFTEGFDCPEVECVAIARPTKSRALYAQMLGRGTRLAAGKESLLVLDFVGNSRRHRLVTPASILAGADVSAEIMEAAERTEGDVLAALESAEAEQQELALAPRTRFWAEATDVFTGLSELPVGDGTGATAAQLATLYAAGFDPPPALTKAEATVLIDAMVKRREAGLCTYKQARFLSRHGIDASAVSFDEASARIGRLMMRWRRRQPTGGATW